MSFQSSSLDDPIWDGGNFNDELFTTTDYNPVNNANLLRDIESLIQNMEKKQTKQEDDSLMLRNIDNILSNIKLNESRPHSPQSNASVEPIRTKSPIVLPTRSDERVRGDVLSIIDNIRDFVSNNIQDIVPDLVSQVEQELTSALNTEEVEEITVENLDEFLRSRQSSQKEVPLGKAHGSLGEKVNEIFVGKSAENLERNVVGIIEKHDDGISTQGTVEIFREASPSPYDSNLEDFLRSRHDEEFAERNISPFAGRQVDGEGNYASGDSPDEDLHEFLRNRQDVEYQERSDDFHNLDASPASHDSITGGYQASDDVDTGNLIVDASPVTAHNEINANGGAPPDLTNAELGEANGVGERGVVESNQLEPLKYKSSFNLKIHRQQTTKRTKSEREFKKRNSLILENALLGRQRQALKKTAARPKSLILPNEPVVHAEPPPPPSPAKPESSNINHQPSLISENIESGRVLSEINASGSGRNVEIEDTEKKINGNDGEEAPGEGLLLLQASFGVNQNEDIATTIEAVADVIINDEIELSPEIINDDAVQAGREVTRDIGVLQSVLPSSSENDPSKAPQNLSELVEDTQRIIKQMKDEINAIYVSDDDYSSSEGADYSGEWVEGFEEEDSYGEEFTGEEEGSEYEDWSGEYEESEPIETAPEDVFDDASAAVEDGNELLDNLSIANEQPDNPSVGTKPSAVNESENARSESVVHGKLELTPMSSNHFKVDASSAAGVASSSATSNDDDINLNNSADLQPANEKADTRPATPIPPPSSAAVNNEIRVPANSIKEIVNEAINDVIRVISSDEAENIVLQGSDNNNPQIAGAPSSPDRGHDDADSSMNNSENILAEVTMKLSDADDSIASVGQATDDEAPLENASNAESEKAETVNDEAESNLLNNDAVDGNVESAKSSITGVENIEKAEAEVDNRIQQPVIEDQQAEGSSAVEQEEGETQNAGEVVLNPESVIENEATDNVVMQTAQASVSTEERNSEASVNIEGEQSKAASDSPIESNQTQKGAVAKTKIPSKVKNAKRKNSVAKGAEKADESSNSNSISSSPEKIKVTVKRETASTAANQTNRKTSFDNSVRKTSVPTPFGLLATSNVKNLQSQFLNKSSAPTAPKAQPTKLKPSKLIPPKSLSKEPTSTFANKLSKLITPSSNAKSNSEKTNHAENSKKEFTRDHSKDVVPEKKYMEHCFSDEYPTTTDDEDEEEAKAPKSFFIKKPPTQDSDDETADVRRNVKEV